MYYTICIIYYKFCLDSKNKKLEVQPSTKQEPEISQSNEQLIL